VNLRICAVAPGRSLRELQGMVREAEKAEADLIEVRIDYQEKPVPAFAVRKLTSLPLIATNRPLREKGLFDGPEEKRLSLLLDAAEAGFEYVDVELSAGNVEEMVEKVKAEGSKPIVSFHDFAGTPPLRRLHTLLRKGLKKGSEVCKIVTTAQRPEDNLTCLEFLAQASKQTPTVAFCMGPRGVFSRVLSPLFGGFFTYASVRRGKESAPGQLTIRETREVYRLMMLDEG